MRVHTIQITKNNSMADLIDGCPFGIVPEGKVEFENYLID